MALALPPEILALSPANDASQKQAPHWRLPPNHAMALRDVARGVEETNAGVCTRYLLDAGGTLDPDAPMRTLFGSDVTDDLEDVPLLDAERFVERFGKCAWRKGILRCRRALALLREKSHDDDVAILHVAYGYPDPSTRTWPTFALELLDPEIAQLVRYVDATEERRVEIVFRRTRAEAPREWTEFACRNLLDHRSGVGAMTALANSPPWERGQMFASPDVIDLARRRDRREHFDRTTSSGEALAEALRDFDEPKPKRMPDEHKSAYADRCAPYHERRAEHDARRRSFVVLARSEAETMLAGASGRYREAWLACRFS